MYKNPKSHLTPYTEDEALAFMVDTRMTKNDYHLTRLGAKKNTELIYILHMTEFDWPKRGITHKIL